jgi:hypothetical protein
MNPFHFDRKSRETVAVAVIKVTGGERMAASTLIEMCKKRPKVFLGQEESEVEDKLRRIIADFGGLVLPDEVRPELWRSPIGRLVVKKLKTELGNLPSGRN